MNFILFSYLIYIVFVLIYFTNGETVISKRKDRVFKFNLLLKNQTSSSKLDARNATRTYDWNKNIRQKGGLKFKLNRKTNLKSKKLKSNGRKYVWNPVGQFWTYVDNYARGYPQPYYSRHYHRPSCPYCKPSPCSGPSMYNCPTPFDCPYQSNCRNNAPGTLKCKSDERAIKFGSRTVCVKMKPQVTGGCTDDCSGNGACLNNKCYCKMDFEGSNCEIIKPDLCKTKLKLNCVKGCNLDTNSHRVRCVCDNNEPDKDCVELRACSVNCGLHGKCVNGVCKCDIGYTGPRCLPQTKNFCIPGQVGHKTCEQLCISTSTTGFQCSCKQGYKLNKDGKTCSSNSKCEKMRGCSGHGDCLNNVCHCYKGWHGLDCSSDIDECRYNSNRCQYGCVNSPGSYRCVCPQGMKLASDKIRCVGCSMRCMNGGRCVNNKCVCGSEFSGEQCEVTNVCVTTKPCQHTCTNVGNHFRCSCYPGYTLSTDGRKCIKSCSSCVNGKCDPSNGNCVCNPGYQGNTCSRDINECGTSRHNCSNYCVNTMGSYICRCPTGYTLSSDGRKCIESCSSCVNGKCDPSNGNCVCNPGYQGETCSRDIDECATGRHKCSQYCANTMGSYICRCRTGYNLIGLYRCQKVLPGKMFCSKNEECLNNGVCVSGECKCTRGYTGKNCEKRVSTNVSCTRDGDCQNDGRCELGNCVCKIGFVGYKCEKDLDECKLSLCNQICTNTVGSFYCTCRAGYMLSDDKRMCFKNCFNCGYGTCKNGKCVCPSGLSGERCQIDADECKQPNKGGCQQKCMNTYGSYKCLCDEGYELNLDKRSCKRSIRVLVEKCNENCRHGNCRSNGKCMCRMGYQGRYCERDVDECADAQLSKVCGHECVNTEGSFHCVCRSGYKKVGKGECVKIECAGPDKCVNGRCVKVVKYDRYGTRQVIEECQCNKGYYGDKCERDIDECEKYHKTCEHQCVNTVGSFKCQCNKGYKLDDNGRSCTAVCPRYCMRGECRKVSGATVMVCVCQKGYGGASCDKDIDECKLGQRIHQCEHNCINTKGSYECTCRPGFYLSLRDGKSCIPTKTNPLSFKCRPSCQNGGQCTRTIAPNGSPELKCVCKPGFLGRTCTDDIDECKWPQSRHGCLGECRNTFGNYECTCPRGYLISSDHKTCRRALIDTNCLPACQNGGVCRTNRRCSCTLGFGGADCSRDVNECIKYRPCDRATSICMNSYGSYKCQCLAGFVLKYDGISCMTEKEAREKPHLRYRGRGTKGY